MKQLFRTALSGCCALALLMCSLISAAAAPVLGVDTSDKVYDYAELFTDSETADLYSRCMLIVEQYGMDAVILTIDSNTYQDAHEYGMEFYDQNGFQVDGLGGFLFIIDMDRREYAIVTAGDDSQSARTIFTDARLSRLEDNAYDYMANGDYHGACAEFLETSEDYIGQSLSASGTTGEHTTAEYAAREHTTSAYGGGSDYESSSTALSMRDGIFLYILCGVAAGVITFFLLRRQNRQITKAGDANDYMDQNSFQLTNKKDVFVTSHVTKTRINQNNNHNGRGGGGGGGISRTSGGGRSFGGTSGRRF